MNSIISKANRCLLIPYDNRFKTFWPELRCLEHAGQRLAVIPHNPLTQIQLRALDIEVPAPILSQYDWCGGVPFETQRRTAAMLTSNTRAYVLSDMGTGKTKAALWAWHYLYKIKCAKRLLVIAPLSTLKFVWLSEITKTLPPGIRAVVLHGDRKQRLELLEQEFDIAIINHDGLKVIAAELYARKDIDTLVLDELAVYRNNSQRSKYMRTFAQRMTWAWGLTGRPMPGQPTDAWAQCKILTPNRVPKFFRHAQSLLMEQVSQYRWVPKAEAVNLAFEWMQPSVRFSLDDVVELPEAIHRTVEVGFTEEQTKAYRKLANEFAVMVQNQQITAANAGVALGKLLQVGAGHIYTLNPLYVSIDSTPRQEMLLELLDEAPHKVIVFAPFRHLVIELSKLLTRNKIDHAVVHGDTPKREEIFNAFENTTRYQVLLAHPGCVHHGLTLVAATMAVWYSPTTSLEIFEQANARIRRPGAQHKQQYFYLQSSPVERRMYTLIEGKQKLQNEFLDLVRTATDNIL